MRNPDLHLSQLCADYHAHQFFLLVIVYEINIFSHEEGSDIIHALSKLCSHKRDVRSLTFIQKKMDEIPKNEVVKFLEKEKEKATDMYNYFMKEDKT